MFKLMPATLLAPTTQHHQQAEMDCVAWLTIGA